MIHVDLLEKYLVSHSSIVSELLIELERETNLRTLSPQMLSGKVQGQFLSMISKITQPKCALEIGTFTGYASLCMAEGLQTDGMLHTIESNEEIIYIPKNYFSRSPYKNQIQLHIGNALHIIPKLNYTFDLVFIDADKENYLEYYHLLMPMMKKGGIILADNVLWYGKVFEEKMDKKTLALHTFNQYVTQDNRVENMIVPIRDGIHFIRII